jgi:RNA polymerase sigma factor (sigma-70 family)
MFDSFPADQAEAPPVASAHAPPCVDAIPPTDGERLMRFRRRRDEAAFRELIEAHAPLVWGVCWQVLRHEQDAEDAFQATFLILARRAASIRETHSVAPWLYRVAFRTALLARRRRLRRAEEPLVDEPLSTDEQLAAVHRREQCLILLEELHALPARLRAPLALCYLEGRSRRAAADELGVTPASVKGLLARGTRMLRSRLMRRGVALSTAMSVAAANASAAHAAMNPALIERTTALGLGFAFHATSVAGGGLPSGASAATLAEKGLQAMTLATAAKPAAGLISVCVAGALAIAAAAAPPASDDRAPGTIAIDGAVATAADDAADDASDVAVTPAAPAAAAAVEPAITAAPAASVLDALVPTSEPAAVYDDFDDDGVYEVAQPAATPAPAVGLPPADPADILSYPIVSPGPGPVVEPQPAAAPVSPYLPIYPSASAPTAAPSVAAIKLEVQYWERRAAGLSKRAEALRVKSELLAREGDDSRADALEAEADAQLALADVKLCEANAQRLQDSLAAMEQPQPATTPVPAMSSVPQGVGWIEPPVVAPVASLPTPTLPAVASVPRTYAIPPDDLFPSNPPVESSPSASLDEMRQQLAELQAANRLLLERIGRLEAEHGDHPK